MDLTEAMRLALERAKASDGRPHSEMTPGELADKAVNDLCGLGLPRKEASNFIKAGISKLMKALLIDLAEKIGKSKGNEEEAS